MADDVLTFQWNLSSGVELEFFLRRHLHIVISLYGVSIICIIFSLHAGLRGSFPAFFGRPLAVQ